VLKVAVAVFPTKILAYSLYFLRTEILFRDQIDRLFRSGIDGVDGLGINP
jgi:hypothetical protein